MRARLAAEPGPYDVSVEVFQMSGALDIATTLNAELWREESVGRFHQELVRAVTAFADDPDGRAGGGTL